MDVLEQQKCLNWSFWSTSLSLKQWVELNDNRANSKLKSAQELWIKMHLKHNRLNADSHLLKSIIGLEWLSHQ